MRCWAVGLVVVVGCGEREPGPSPDEYGSRFLWTYAGELSLTMDECTDDPEFVSIFEDLRDGLVGTSVAYEVADDGATADVLDCETTDLSACGEKDPALVLEIDGHHLAGESEESRDELRAGCDLVSFAVLDVIDEGTSATIAAGLRHALRGDCDGVDELLVGDNGFGVDGCTALVEGEGTLDAVE